MANLNINYFSPCLQYNTNLKIFIPTPSVEEIAKQKTNYFKIGVNFPVLYLLHDLYEDASDWQNYTNIVKYAQENHIIVVMPSVGNSFYQDMYKGANYFTFITEELPAYIQKYFPASHKISETYIGGVNIGGYGAMHIALHQPHRFGYVFSILGSLDICNLNFNELINCPINLDDIFENYDDISNTKINLRNQITSLNSNKITKEIKFFLSCSENDISYNTNLEYLNLLKNNNFSVTFDSGEGNSKWAYCDKALEKALKWIKFDYNDLNNKGLNNYAKN